MVYFLTRDNLTPSDVLTADTALDCYDSVINLRPARVRGLAQNKTVSRRLKFRFHLGAASRNEPASRRFRQSLVRGGLSECPGADSYPPCRHFRVSSGSSEAVETLNIRHHGPGGIPRHRQSGGEAENVSLFRHRPLHVMCSLCQGGSRKRWYVC